MKIAIVGPGAMGCLFGGFLAESGEEVWLLDRRKQRAEQIISSGLKIEGISGEHKVKVNVTVDPARLGVCDLVIYTVKSYDTLEAAKNTGPLAGEDTALLTLQNGVGNVEALGEVFGRNRIIGGVTSEGATVLGPGHIRHAGNGDTIIGSVSQPKAGLRDRLKNIAETFTKAGFSAKVSDNVRDLIWSKLIINVGINALTGITRLNNGRLVEFETTKQILKEAVLEAVAVTKQKGIKLTYPDPVEKVESVCVATGANVSSMLQDILKRRKTEIDYINGAIVKEGESLNIPTPVNTTLTNLIKTIESSYEKWVEKI